LGNIDTLQNFVHMYDEHWFILVHVEIESIAADILAAIASVKRKLAENIDADLSAWNSGASKTPCGDRLGCSSAFRSTWIPTSITRLSGTISVFSKM